MPRENYYRSAGTRCQLDPVIYDKHLKSKGTGLKNLFHTLIESNSKKRDREPEFNADIPVCRRNKATTKSCKYDNLQQRAENVVFYRNNANFAIPNYDSKQFKKGKIENNIYEESTMCEQLPSMKRKLIGTGTNCDLNFSWFKDRHAYGEPQLGKSHVNAGASLDACAGITCYNAATQSRRYRERDLRAGRQTFYKERHTSCLPQFDKANIESNLNKVPVIQAPPSDRKAIGLGSSCNFCFEYFKDMPPTYTVQRPYSSIYDKKQNQNDFFSRVFRQKQEIKYDSSNNKRVNACTYTDDNDTKVQEQGEENVTEEGLKEKNYNKKIKVCSKNGERPLHLGSSFNFDFKFFRTIPAPKPKVTFVEQQDDSCECFYDEVDENCDLLSKAAACEPGECVKKSNDNTTDDITSSTDPNILPPPEKITKKNHLFGFASKKRPSKSNKEIKTESKGFKSKKHGSKVTKDSDKNKASTKEKQESRQESGESKVTIFSSKSETKYKDVNEADRPLRIGSNFSLDYNTSMRSSLPTHTNKRTINNKPQLEPLEKSSSASLKKTFFRLIMGKMRKPSRIKRYAPKLNRIGVDRSCDPYECYKRKQEEKSWFSLILSSIKRRRPVKTSNEYELKKFFSGIISESSTSSGLGLQKVFSKILTASNTDLEPGPDYGPKEFFSDIILSKSTSTSQSSKQATKCKNWFSRVLLNARDDKRDLSISDRAESDARSFFSQLLFDDVCRTEACECNAKRRRKRRRRLLKKLRNTTGSTTTETSQMSKYFTESDEECIPCRIKTVCDYGCDYKTSKSSDDTGTISSERESIKYATN